MTTLEQNKPTSQVETIDTQNDGVENLAIAERINTSQKDQGLHQNEIVTQNATQTLENAIFKNLDLPQIQNIIESYDNEKMKITVDELLEKYENLAKWISSAEWSWATKRHLKHRLNENSESLRRIKDDLGKYTYSNLSTYKARVGELIYYFEHYEQVRQIVVLWWRTSDIHAIIDSKQDARRARRQEKQNVKYQSSMNDILHEAALTSLWNNDMERYEEYLEAVLNWQVEPSTHPFFTKHKGSFAIIQSISPELYWALAPKRWWQITYNTYCQRNPEMYAAYCRNNNIVCRPKSFNEKMGKNVTDVLAKVFPWIDSDPRKRQAWEKAGSVVALGWAVVLWFKFLQSLFSKKSEWKWKDVGIYWWSLLALLNADKIINWTKDAFGRHPAEKSRMLAESFKDYGFSDIHAIEIANKYVWAPVATMSALHFIPMYELESEKILENKNGEFEFNYNNYETYVNKFAWDNEQKKYALATGKKLEKDKSIWDGLKAFGITTWEKFKSLFGSDKNKTLADTEEVKREWAKMSERVWSEVNKKLFDNWFKATSPEAVDQIIDEYEKEKNNKKISELILKWMDDWLLEFKEDKPYTMAEMKENPNIDLEKMTMKWFKSWTNEVVFSSYGELFDTAYLTDKIKYNFAWVKANSDEPFKINSVWQLKFDDKDWYELLKNDTTVISRRSFTRDFDTLKKNKDYYVNYLNQWWKETSKVNIDAATYPIVNKLGIDFYSDEQEVKNVENWLTNLKNSMNSAGSVPKKPTPFSFGILGTWIIDKLNFTNVSGSTDTIDTGLSSKFPTIWKNWENRQKLLDFLNNPDNGMCDRS